jgi:hypothetical protein
MGSKGTEQQELCEPRRAGAIHNPKLALAASPLPSGIACVQSSMDHFNRMRTATTINSHGPHQVGARWKEDEMLSQCKYRATNDENDAQMREMRETIQA